MIQGGFQQVVEVAGRKIGPGQPCCVVAEIGINHNGDMELAREEIDAAAEAGADVIKFQNYYTEDFLSDPGLTFTYRSQGREVTESQFEMFKRCELGRDQLADLKAHCDRHEVLFQSTPMSRRGLSDLISIGAPLLKNNSTSLSNLDLVRSMGETGIPTVISTGMATVSEIDESLRAYRETGNDKLILLYCISAYPTPAAEVNLSRMATLERVFGCPVGFSDHTEGLLAAALASALGACLIEKHFTLDHDLPGPDHWFSMTPGELAELVQTVNQARKMIGDPGLGPAPSEAKGRLEYRLSCVAGAPLDAGHRLAAGEIAFHRPGHGMAPSHSRFIAGRVLRRPVAKGHVFVIEDFE